jgi:hypothetical protein
MSKNGLPLSVLVSMVSEIQNLSLAGVASVSWGGLEDSIACPKEVSSECGRADYVCDWALPPGSRCITWQADRPILK